MRLTSLALAALAVLPAACSLDPGKSVGMQDSLQITLFGPAQNDLHTPYVAGAHFSVSVTTTDYTTKDTADWRIRSSNPTVLAIDSFDAKALSASVAAVGVGTTTLSVVDSQGHVYDQKDVEVDAPDHIQLMAHGLLMAGIADDQARVSEADLVAGGTATFLVRYLKGNTVLYGNGALVPTATGAVGVRTTTSSFGTDYDWLEVDAQPDPGPGSIQLGVGGGALATIPASVVAPSAITRLGLAAQSESGAKDGDSRYVFARAFDAQGRDLFGGSFAWSADGASVDAGSLGGPLPADMVSYQYKGSGSERLVASLQGDSVGTTVHGAGAATTSVSSSAATPGCSVATPGAPGGALLRGLLGVVVALAGAGLRRRRARAQGTA